MVPQLFIERRCCIEKITKNIKIFLSSNNVYLNGGNSDGTYVSLSTATKKYSLYKHADGTYTVTTPAKDCYRYDSAGRCIQVMDDNGRETLISYEDASNSKTITEPVSGKHLYIHYNAEGMVTQVSDDNGRSATFAYTDGNLTAYTNVLGETTTFTYDESNRILTDTRPRRIYGQGGFVERG